MKLKVLNRRYLLLLLIFFKIQTGWSQIEILSLEQCQREVQENYPLVKGKDLLRQSSDLKMENLKVSNLPRLYANGKFSYQSDVTGFSSPSMSTPKAPKDQYALNIDVEQLIYDGGKTKDRIEVEEKTTEMEIKSLEIQMYQLRERVNTAFFGIQLVRKNKLVLSDKRKTISNRMKQVKSAVENGVIIPANLQVLESELLLIDQQILELNYHEESLFNVLSQLMGRNLSADTKLRITRFDENAIIDSDVVGKLRPEYQLYSSQRSLLDAQRDLLKKERYPIVIGFGQVGYGNPGYNQLKDEFDTYYRVGAKVSWNIFDWHTNRRKKKGIEIEKDLVATKELSFSKNQLIETGTEDSKIRKFKILLQKDDAIILLKKEISQSSASKLDNGVITSSDYLEDLNKEIHAKLNKEYHKIQLQQAVAELERIKGMRN